MRNRSVCLLGLVLAVVVACAPEAPPTPTVRAYEIVCTTAPQ